MIGFSKMILRGLGLAAVAHAGVASADPTELVQVTTKIKINDNDEKSATMLVRFDHMASIEDTDYFIEVTPRHRDESILLELKVGRVTAGRHVLANPQMLVKDGATGTISQENDAGEKLSLSATPKILE